MPNNLFFRVDSPLDLAGLSLHYFFKTFFFRAVLGPQQNWGKGRDIPHVPHGTHMHSAPHQYSSPEWCICYNWWTYTDTPSSSPKYIVYSRAHPWCCVFHEFGQIIMTSIYHYSITQSIFQCPKNPLYIPYLFLPSSLTRGNHCSFCCPHSFAFFRVSYSWDHTMYNLSRLASFI